MASLLWSSRLCGGASSGPFRPWTSHAERHRDRMRSAGGVGVEGVVGGTDAPGAGPTSFQLPCDGRPSDALLFAMGVRASGAVPVRRFCSMVRAATLLSPGPGRGRRSRRRHFTLALPSWVRKGRRCAALPSPHHIVDLAYAGWAACLCRASSGPPAPWSVGLVRFVRAPASSSARPAYWLPEPVTMRVGPKTTAVRGCGTILCLAQPALAFQLRPLIAPSFEVAAHAVRYCEVVQRIEGLLRQAKLGEGGSHVDG